MSSPWASFDSLGRRPARSARFSAGSSARTRTSASNRNPTSRRSRCCPPFPGARSARCSASGPARNRSASAGFVWGLAADGSLEGEPIELDLSPLYGRLRERAPELNIEGAAALGEQLWLFHRGNTEQALNIVAEVPLRAFIDSVRRDGRIECGGNVRARAYELGELDGVPLTFSDATPLADELVVFTASAEPGSDPHGTDGEIRGSVVGTIDGDGRVERLRTIDREWKVEGVYASIDARVIDFLFVCDQDDPDTASPLLSAAMPIESRFETA